MAGSSADDSAGDGAEPAVSVVTRRTMEIYTAAAVGVVGAVVAAESLTHDIAWNEAGPGSGYFPFRVGVLIIAVALIQAIRGTGSANPMSHVSGPVTIPGGTGSASQTSHASGPVTFVSRDELRRTLSVFWPAALLVAAMFPLGSYLPSAAYLAWMMRRHGGRGWLVSSAYGAAVMAIFFLIFDVWFRVPLARGPW